MDFKAHKKKIWVACSSIVAVLSILFFYLWYRSHNTIRYAISPASLIAITGNDYETTLKKLHNLSLIQEIENDDAIELLQPKDFLKLEIAHAPYFKQLIQNHRHVLSFKVDAQNQLQSLLAIEGNNDLYKKILDEIIGNDYEIVSYSSPSGEIKEAYNSKKEKELVLSFTRGVIVISNEALYAEETLAQIKDHVSFFTQAKLNFTSNYIYIKEAALQRWVSGVTQNHTSEFYQWFEAIDEIELKLNDEGTLANTRLFFSKESQNQTIVKDRQPFKLEKWLKEITSNYVAFHPDTADSEIKLNELYRCYTNLQDENIINNTFVLAESIEDSIALQKVFSSHSMSHTIALNKFKIYKFGKYPFFKNFCNSSTPDLPECYVTIVSNHAFVVTSSTSSMIPILQKIKRKPITNSSANSGVFVMQVQPQNLLPYFSKIINEKYSVKVIESSFLQQLDFIQYRIDSVENNSAVGAIYFNKNAIKTAVNTELLWSKLLEQDPSDITVIKSNGTGENYILYQDSTDVLHCIDFKTNELWQRFVLGKIQSEIYATDLYHNHQNQFIFNTSNQIYALNDKGADMKGFPKQVYSEGVKGMYLFDMGDKYEYFFVQRNMIYGFDAGGVSLKDWRPKQAPINIQKDLLQFKKRNNNYIVGINNRGEVLIWNRFGKRVERDIAFNSTNLSEFFITPPVNTHYRPELICTDTTGRLFSITLDSLRRKEYRYTLNSDNPKRFATQTTDSNFQKVIYQNKSNLLFFDRYTQKTDTFKLEVPYRLQSVFTVNLKQTFIVVSDGESSRVLSSNYQLIADKIEGKILEILQAEIPGNYFVVAFDSSKRVNLYMISQ